MMSGMYAATSGLDAHQKMLDVTADNLANVDTVGYKRQSLQFADQLAQTVAAATSPNGFSAGTNPVQVGFGVHVGSIDNVMSAGGVRATANATDVAIQGEGFLRVAYGDMSGATPSFEPPQYTRAGDLTAQPERLSGHPDRSVRARLRGAAHRHGRLSARDERCGRR